MRSKVLQSVCFLIGFVALVGSDARAQSLQTLNLEFRLPTGENPFARHVWLCAECDLADWAAAMPAAGFEQTPPRLNLYDEARANLPTPPPGIPPALDFVPTVAGEESVYVAKVLGGQILGFNPIFQVLALAQVQRDTRLLYSPGTVVHQVTDPLGHTYSLFTFDLMVSGFVDLSQVGALAGFPLPAGWSYSSHVLTSDLLVVSNGLARVFVQGGASTWQRHETVPVAVSVKPGGDPDVNPKSNGVVPVAILGEIDFDVTSIDPSTLAFGPAGAAPAHTVGGHVEHVDGDGIPDLVSHYRVGASGIESGSTQACVSGQTLEGVSFAGCGTISTP
jgi:hypothetical protein